MYCSRKVDPEYCFVYTAAPVLQLTGNRLNTVHCKVPLLARIDHIKLPARPLLYSSLTPTEVAGLPLQNSVAMPVQDLQNESPWISCLQCWVLRGPRRLQQRKLCINETNSTFKRGLFESYSVISPLVVCAIFSLVLRACILSSLSFSSSFNKVTSCLAFSLTFKPWTKKREKRMIFHCIQGTQNITSSLDMQIIQTLGNKHSFN